MEARLYVVLFSEPLSLLSRGPCGGGSREAGGPGLEPGGNGDYMMDVISTILCVC